MKKFIATLSVFTVLVVAVVYICNRNYYPTGAKGNDGYIGAIVDKHAYAAKIKLPRILFCGGSNVAFGINSKRIADSLGIPVVNLGLLGSLGLDFMLNEAKAVARPSDIVIVSPEYELSVDGAHTLKKEAQRIFPQAGTYFKTGLEQFITDFFIEDLQKNFAVTLAHLLHRPQKGFPTNVVYSRSSFNQYGDVVRNFTNPSKDFFTKVKLNYRPYAGIKNLNSFKDYADKNHIKVFFLYPGFPQSLYKKSLKPINAYADEFDRELKIKILIKPSDAIFPDSVFYDTEYHLLPSGRELRTDKVIALLKKEKLK
ncbi:hypothetical protein [Mucilaginibacter glaciei]|uniref:Uncharacterized protein n=1 Tax=Mucilaginibacter glaciei TaxID=2772109 RepID=A0A926NSV7_9SPHI|nr:hypothetical protein [Mucilaginibacter glaciei]MBD1393997.1 hypothetical protein [Mucilaginibacter glaciei]